MLKSLPHCPMGRAREEYAAIQADWPRFIGNQIGLLRLAANFATRSSNGGRQIGMTFTRSVPGRRRSADSNCCQLCMRCPCSPAISALYQRHPPCSSYAERWGDLQWQRGHAGCDMSLASREKTIISQWEVGVGMVAGGGPMAWAARLIGRTWMHSWSIMVCGGT